MWTTRCGRPAATRRFSLQPVVATCSPKTPTIAVPSTGRSCAGSPAMTSAAMRPWRFAVLASGTSTCSPSRASRFSTASPTARIRGSLVRKRLSTRMPPRRPVSRPASSARRVSGRTPTAETTRSASTCSPDPSVTVSGPMEVTEVPRRSVTPEARRWSWTGPTISGSRGAITWSAASTTVTAIPRRVRFSASSSPMKPPPMIAAVRAGRLAATSASVSSTSRSERARSMPGIGGRTGRAPGARSTWS